jgi:hypothetical protein
MHKKCIAQERFRRASTIDHDAEKAAGSSASEVPLVEGVSVKVFGIVKTVADCFRYRNKIGLSVAIEGLQEALRQRKATPAELARLAEDGGVATVIRPYLERSPPMAKEIKNVGASGRADRNLAFTGHPRTLGKRR